MNPVYCSIKFKELSVHVQSRLLYNCCKAWPERIDLDWLEKNPGKLFHTPTMIQDRTDMLSGKKCKSCDWGCYRYEEQGQTSKRTKFSKFRKENDYIDDPYVSMKHLDLSLSTECNLTCAYCNAEWSSSWGQDIRKNGEYDIEGYNNRIDNWQELWKKLKQKKRSTDSKFFRLLLKEIELAKGLETINILGGEPLLNNNLFEVIEKVNDKRIIITTGLGVSDSRFETFLEKIKNKKNISLMLSCDAIGPTFEFVRYGASWKKFHWMIESLEKNNIEFHFNSVITNLNSFKIEEFYNLFSDKHRIVYGPVTDRMFLQPNVLDDISKKQLSDSISNRLEEPFFKQLYSSMNQPYNEQQKKDCKKFLMEFSKRRNLSLDIFPEHFLKWLEII